MNVYDFLRVRFRNPYLLAWLPLVLSGLFACPALGEASFSAEIRGARTLSLNGEALVRKVSSGAVITLAAGRDGDLILISLPSKIRIGTHKLDSWQGDYDLGKSRTFGISFSTFRSKTESVGAKFESLIEGTLEVEGTSPLNAQFSCSLDGGLEGVVKIKGTLNSLPYPLPEAGSSNQVSSEKH